MCLKFLSTIHSIACGRRGHVRDVGAVERPDFYGSAGTAFYKTLGPRALHYVSNIPDLTHIVSDSPLSVSCITGLWHRRWHPPFRRRRPVGLCAAGTNRRTMVRHRMERTMKTLITVLALAALI